MNASIFCTALLISVGGILAACSEKQSAIRKPDHVLDYFNRQLRNERNAYELPGVTHRTLVNYEVVSRATDLVIVKLTFASDGRGDIVSTKRFAIDADTGRMKSLDPYDISESIRIRLICLCNMAKSAFRDKGEPVTWNLLVKQKLILPSEFSPFDNEDYTTLVFREHQNIAYRTALEWRGQTIEASGIAFVK